MSKLQEYLNLCKETELLSVEAMREISERLTALENKQKESGINLPVSWESLVNDAIAYVPLPGSIGFKEGLEWIVKNLPRLVELDKLIRQMPIGCSLHRDSDFWQVHQIQKAHEVEIYDLFQSPEEALLAAGVGKNSIDKNAFEESVHQQAKAGMHSDDGFPPDYAVNIGGIRPKEEA